MSPPSPLEEKEAGEGCEQGNSWAGPPSAQGKPPPSSLRKRVEAKGGREEGPLPARVVVQRLGRLRLRLGQQGEPPARALPSTQRGTVWPERGAEYFRLRLSGAGVS